MTLRRLWTGTTHLDRLGAVRATPDLLHAALTDPATRVLDVHGDAVAARDGALLHRAPTAADAEGSWLIGTDGTTTYVAHLADTTDGLVGLRSLAAGLDGADATIASTAVHLARWHTRHRFCAVCGGATAPDGAGWARRCVQCDELHFPRVDPCVIVRVTDGEDRLLLGRGPTWAPRRFSMLAGFVDPSESFEDCVEREVLEEVGLHVTDVRYLGSHPWPFAGQIMIAFAAFAADPALHLATDEIAEARWVTRAELRDLLAREEIGIPDAYATANWMIHTWLAEEPAER